MDSFAILKTRLFNWVKNGWKELLSGILLAGLTYALAYVINRNLARSEVPTFENNILKAFTLVFFGLYLGYNLAMSRKESKKEYYFFVGLLLPLFIFVLLITLFNQDIILPIIMLLSISFSLSIISSSLVEVGRFAIFIEVFAKYVPIFLLTSTSVNDYLIDSIYAIFGVHPDIVSYILALIISVGVLIIYYYIRKLEGESTGDK